VDHDDWRVTISFPHRVDAERAKVLLPRRKVAADASRRLGYTIAVGAGDSRVFLYAGTEVAAREAERVARDALARHDFQAEFAIHRWHPGAQRWEDRGVPMPRTEAERQTEHQRLLDDETAESLATGVAQWQARAEFPSHDEAVALASRLSREGRPVIRRWKFLVVGANNEDDAQEIADQIRREAPADATVRAEHSPVYVPFAGF
jgi:hypothetical protein